MLAPIIAKAGVDGKTVASTNRRRDKLPSEIRQPYTKCTRYDSLADAWQWGWAGLELNPGLQTKKS